MAGHACSSPNTAQDSSINRDGAGARFIVVMGVSGTGKSTLGTALAEALHVPFVDGDDLHPAANVAKMSRGEPLDDVDRWPWLETIRRTAVACVLAQSQVGPAQAEHGTDTSAGEANVCRAGRGTLRRDDGQGPGVVVACSALKKTYRAVLRGEGEGEGEGEGPGSTSLHTRFVYLEGDRDVLVARLRRRQGHFMKAGMLESQLDALESPEGEPDVVTVAAETSTAEQVQRVLDALGLNS